MEIGLIYSSNDPKQKRIREFLVNFINEHGVCATLIEKNQPVKEPTITIDGLAINKQQKSTSSKRRTAPLLSLEQIASALEQRIWCL